MFLKEAQLQQINIHHAKTHLSRLLERVEAGEEIIIARAGKPIARLTRWRPAVERRRLGLFAGQLNIPADFDDLPSDLQEAFEGEDP